MFLSVHLKQVLLSQSALEQANLAVAGDRGEEDMAEDERRDLSEA